MDYSDKFLAQFLVPGGRFLFVNSSNDVGVYVKLWDLVCQTASAGESNPCIFLQISVSGHEPVTMGHIRCRWWQTQNGSTVTDGQHARHSLSQSHPMFKGLSFSLIASPSVYEVQVDDQPRLVSFTHLGSLKVATIPDKTIGHFKIIGDRILAGLPDRLVVWDLVSRRYYILSMEWTSQYCIRGISHIHIVTIGLSFLTVVYSLCRRYCSGTRITYGHTCVAAFEFDGS